MTDLQAKLTQSLKQGAFRNIRIHRRIGTESQVLDISLRRTIRAPDNGKLFDLPPDMGTFPIYNVFEHASKLPPNLAEKGGVFVPMYQREAMWLKFKSDSHFAVKVFVGGINAVSGEPSVETPEVVNRRKERLAKGESVQDYVVPPSQLWLDGIATLDGTVRQFVATPVGSGYSIEAQITGKDNVAGIQFEVIPQKPTIPSTDGSGAGLRGGGPSDTTGSVRKVMSVESLGAGGLLGQVVNRDPMAPDSWDTDKAILFNIQLFDATCFRDILGIDPPETPITAATYARHGYPFFKLYEQPSGVFGNFDLKSVGTLDKEKGANAETHQEEENIAFPSVRLGWDILGHTDNKEVKLNTVDKKSIFTPVSKVSKLWQK